mmetsp:Transcript_26728/g.74879  ORF Transcript_26728/g.74879 Transcript_26728/m.74879 type:complete len:247 (-) Transcript_26728:669-1409(-)
MRMFKHIAVPPHSTYGPCSLLPADRCSRNDSSFPSSNGLMAARPGLLLAAFTSTNTGIGTPSCWMYETLTVDGVGGDDDEDDGDENEDEDDPKPACIAAMRRWCSLPMAPYGSGNSSIVVSVILPWSRAASWKSWMMEFHVHDTTVATPPLGSSTRRISRNAATGSSGNVMPNTKVQMSIEASGMSLRSVMSWTMVLTVTLLVALSWWIMSLVVFWLPTTSLPLTALPLLLSLMSLLYLECTLSST